MASLAKVLKHLYRATIYSFEGLKSAFQKELAFRVEVYCFMPFFLLALFLGDSGLERAVLVFCLFMVIIAELINSGIEAAIDRVSEDWHPLSKHAKDCGSAAVFITLILTLVVWCLILLPKIL